MFGAFILTKNTNIDKYEFFGYGIGFDRHGFISHPSGGTGRNVIIFRVDMRSSTKIDSRKKDILIFVKGPTQGLKHALSSEKIYSINFIENNYVWVCIIVEQTVIYLLMVEKLINLMQKILRF